MKGIAGKGMKRIAGISLIDKYFTHQRTIIFGSYITIGIFAL